jgi:hypothetical protein
MVTPNSRSQGMYSQRGHGAMRWSSQDRMLVLRVPDERRDLQPSAPTDDASISEPASRPTRPLDEQCIDPAGRLWISNRGARVRVRLRVARGLRLDPSQDLLLASNRRLPPAGTSRTRCRISADEVGFAAWAS